MPALLRLLRAAVVAAFLAAAVTWPASAHALLRSSQPAAGESLASSPADVTLTFTEAPDPRLSSIKVLDSTGTAVSAAAAEAVPGAPTQLSVQLPALVPGVYTVSWRALSSVDGHVAAGSFAFAVGVAVPPNEEPPSTSGSSQLTTPGVAGRWVLYAGLVVLLGACWMLLRGGRERWPAVPDARPLGRLVGLASLAVLAGTLIVIADQFVSSGAAPGDIVGSSIGAAVALRLAPLILIAVGMALIYRQHTSRPAVIVLCIAALTGMLVDAALSHAAAASQPLFDGAVQWLHFVAAGVWLGGLASLVVWLRNRAPDETATNVAKRFSAVATLGLAAIVVTGVLRAIAEIGTVDALVATDFGRVVIAKSVLLLALAALGATNHFWNIPRGLGGLRLLRRIAPIELGLAAVVLLLSATLVNLAPPADASAQQLANAIVADGSDIATSVRAQLTASPGTVGLNEFSIVARDFDSGAALIPTAVTLRFSLPARADVGASRLDLAADSDGTFAASGANLSIDGTWRVVAIVTLPATAVEVPFDVTTRIVRQPVDVSRQPGLPTIYTIHLDAGVTVQAYVDPGTPGQDEVHATFFDASGTEMPVTSATMSLVSSSGAAIPLVPRILEPGHFVADATLDAGTYLLTVSAPAPDGRATLLARADVEVTP